MGASHLSGPLVLTGSAGVVFGSVKPLIPSTALAAVAGNIFSSTDTGLYVNWLRIALTGGTGSEQDTAIDLPVRGLVLPEVFVYVSVAEATGATKTLDVGLLASETGGDADGFLDGIDVSATGIKKGTLVSTGQTLGALLRVDESGAGVLVPEMHVLNGTAKSVSRTTGSAFTEFVGTLFIPYIEVAT